MALSSAQPSERLSLSNYGCSMEVNFPAAIILNNQENNKIIKMSDYKKNLTSRVQKNNESAQKRSISKDQKDSRGIPRVSPQSMTLRGLRAAPDQLP